MMRIEAIDSVKEVKVIRTIVIKRAGTEDAPCRLVAQYWSLSGRFICEEDASICREDPEP